MTDRLIRHGNYVIRRPQAEPETATVPFEETPLGIVVSVAILLTLFIGIPFLVWLVTA